MGRDEIRRQLAEARTSRERLFGELENLKARAEVDDANEGLAERIQNVNRGIQASDERIADYEQQLGRYAELERMAADPRHLEVGDLDFAENKIRLRRKTVKGQRSVRARTVQVPGWLMDVIAATLPPLDDRDPAARVFPGFTIDGARGAMARACVAAGIPHFTPYSLRHRRTSLWHGQGVPIRELMARTGHAKSSTTLDVYSHVLVDKTELSAAELLSRCGPGVVGG